MVNRAGYFCSQRADEYTDSYLCCDRYADTNLLAQLGSVSVNTWYEVDVTSVVTGINGALRTFNAIIANEVNYGSDNLRRYRRKGKNPPEIGRAPARECKGLCDRA